MSWLNWPNRVTLARILLVVPLVICLLNLNMGWPGIRYVTLVLFVLMGVSDAVDGFLARWLKEETPLGRFLDPIADKLLVICAVVILATEEGSVRGFRLPSWVPVIAVSKDILVVLGFAVVYLATNRFLIRPRIWGKLCTLVQLVMVGWTLLAPDLAPVLQCCLVPLYWLASTLAVVATLDYLRLGTRFAATTPPAGK
ncbi:MAG TPA: CDP-alcohol phosphatidyltransferase family protein [Phycisphaerae bacterium]|nr:CDP-alcohol phosphatidyltransferase family protein [Phycisphaerae bacterium]HNU45424.1 CDP-alcohol phosphatidyltransferase family protein [Phycisphaerae bacterium]